MIHSDVYASKQHQLSLGVGLRLVDGKAIQLVPSVLVMWGQLLGTYPGCYELPNCQLGHNTGSTLVDMVY